MWKITVIRKFKEEEEERRKKNTLNIKEIKKNKKKTIRNSVDQYSIWLIRNFYSRVAQLRVNAFVFVFAWINKISDIRHEWVNPKCVKLRF